MRKIGAMLLFTLSAAACGQADLGVLTTEEASDALMGGVCYFKTYDYNQFTGQPAPTKDHVWRYCICTQPTDELSAPLDGGWTAMDIECL